MANITGTNQGETHEGTSGRDVIDALGGNDVLIGYEGNDVLKGGDGDDFLVGGTGNDSLTGGAGIDTARYETEVQAASSGVVMGTFSGALLSLNAGAEGTDVINSVEHLSMGARTFDIVNRNVVAQLGNDAVSVNETDASVSGNVRDNDYDVDSSLMLTGISYGETAGVLGQPLAGAHGSLTINADGSYSYAPSDTTQGGEDSFTYSVVDGGETRTVTLTITVNPINDAPVITSSPGPFSTDENTLLTGTVTASDEEGDTLTFRQVSAPPPSQDRIMAEGDKFLAVAAPGLQGLTVNANGTWSFDANANPEANALNTGESMQFSFTVVANDGQADSEPQTITFTVYGANERIDGGAGPNVITGTAGPDDIYGGESYDTINGGDGNDNLFGNGGADKLNGGEGDDAIYGGEGADSIRGEGGNDVLYGEGGNDSLDGGAGNDFVFGGAGNDSVKGGAGNDVVVGGEGDDFISGDAGDDVLIGDGGRDTLSGGLGVDYFIFNDGDTGATASTADLITDYKAAQGDVINLDPIDADTTLDGNQAFTQVMAFSGTAGQLTVSYDGGTNLTTVAMDTNGDMTADMMIQLSGNIPTINFIY